jgi:hypothetical protein
VNHGYKSTRSERNRNISYEVPEVCIRVALRDKVRSEVIRKELETENTVNSVTGND